jgi:hypothetical protein
MKFTRTCSVGEISITRSVEIPDRFALTSADREQIWIELTEGKDSTDDRNIDPCSVDA